MASSFLDKIKFRNAIMTIPLKNLQIKPQHWNEMISNVQEKFPEEACGLLIGLIGAENYQVEEVYPTTNQFHSATRYQIEPVELLHVFNVMEEKQMDLVAIYHSHPKGPNTLSQTDIEKAYYPEAIYLLFSKENQAWQGNAFILQADRVIETPILIDDS
jgi:[CysO sulfur-carrier protein]-S-L-cysteine hydrolase